MSYLDELKRQAIHLDLEICVAETRINKILRDAKHWRIQRIGDLGLKPLMAIHAESFRAARKCGFDQDGADKEER